MRFGDVLERVVCGDGACFGAEIPDDWGQGRATYGGLVAALSYRATRVCGGSDRPPRGLLASFVGPVAPGPVELRVELVRAGRAASQYLVRITQGDDTKAILQLVFGDARVSSVHVAGDPRPDAPGPEAVSALVFEAGAMPEFTRHFEYHLTLGEMTFRGADAQAIGGWCRFREPEPKLDRVEMALALTDAWPVPVLPMLRAVAPASSLTWSVEFVAPAADTSDGLAGAIAAAHPDPNGWWYYEARADAAHGGYVQSGARLWTPDGHLAVVSRQLGALFG